MADNFEKTKDHDFPITNSILAKYFAATKEKEKLDKFTECSFYEPISNSSCSFQQIKPQRIAVEVNTSQNITKITFYYLATTNDSHKVVKCIGISLFEYDYCYLSLFSLTLSLSLLFVSPNNSV